MNIFVSLTSSSNLWIVILLKHHCNKYKLVALFRFGWVVLTRRCLYLHYAPSAFSYQKLKSINIMTWNFRKQIKIRGNNGLEYIMIVQRKRHVCFSCPSVYSCNTCGCNIWFILLFKIRLFTAVQNEKNGILFLIPTSFTFTYIPWLRMMRANKGNSPITIVSVQ